MHFWKFPHQNDLTILYFHLHFYLNIRKFIFKQIIPHAQVLKNETLSKDLKNENGSSGECVRP